MEDKKKGTINLDELKVEYGEPKWTEEIRRNEKGEIIAYVLKRNPNYLKKQ